MTESILAGLQARARAAHELIRDRHLDLELPSYGGELVVRYRPPEFGVVQPKMEKFLMLDGEERLYASCDLMIACCEMVLLRVNGELVPLHEAVTADSSGGDVADFATPVKLDTRLVRAVGRTMPTAEEEGPGPGRLAVITAIGDDYALCGQAAQLATWLQQLLEGGQQDF